MKTLRAEEPQAPHRWRGTRVEVPKAYLLGGNGMMSRGSAAQRRVRYPSAADQINETNGHEGQASRGID